MSDDMKSPHEEAHGLNRRGFLGAPALTGAATLVGASALDNAVVGREARAAGKGERGKTEAALSELDGYYGFWSGGHSGEVCVLGVPSMRELIHIPVFNVDSVTGWGLTNESKWVLGDGACFLNGDCHHPHISTTDGKYGGKYLLINDKANSRAACVYLDVMKCDHIVTIPNVQAIHGPRLQKVPRTRYVLCNVEFIIPHPNDGSTFNLPGDNAFTLYNAADAETMEVAWQVIVGGNLDNIDMDCSGRFAVSTCYSPKKAIDLDDMIHNECDWAMVFDIPCIEAEIKAKRFITLGNSKVPVVDDRRKNDKDSPVIRYIPVPKNLHGPNTSPDGKYFIANGKLSPTYITIAIERLGDLFADKLADPRSVVVGKPELGLGPLHTTFDSRGNAYTTLFIDSQSVKWNLVDAVRAYKGKKVDYIRQKLDVQYQPGHNCATLCETSEADGKRTVVLSKFSKDRFLLTSPLHSENDQLIDTSGEEMKLVHDGPTFAEPHDYILVRRDQIKTRKTWDRKDPFFAETVKHAEKDDIDLMKDNKIIREGNKVRVYTVSMASSLDLTELKVKQGDEATVTIANLDEIEGATHGFVTVDHGVCMEINPQQTSSTTFVADKPRVRWYYRSWFCHVLHVKMCGRMLVEKA